jgi:serine/threonine protein kinase
MRGEKLSNISVMEIADQIIARLQHLHAKHVIHRDIKPHNFLMGYRRNNNLVHIIDYGLVKLYRDNDTLVHIPYQEGNDLCGTARFASINTHNGI